MDFVAHGRYTIWARPAIDRHTASYGSCVGEQQNMALCSFPMTPIVRSYSFYLMSFVRSQVMLGDTN